MGIVRDQLDLLNKLFVKFDSQPYFMGTPLEKLHCLNGAVEFVQTTDGGEKRFMGIVKKLRTAFSLVCSSDELQEREKDVIYFYFAIKSILHKLTR